MSVDESPTRPEEGTLVTDDVPSDELDGLSSPIEPLADFPEISDETSKTPSGPAPVEASARLGSVDVLRGVALLGILAMNIVGMAWPHEVYGTPTLAPGASWPDLGLWLFNHIVFDTKMMTIFSMLFGAGLVLMSDRAEARGVSLRGVYYRRILILLLIGIVHAYLIWDGDVLVPYAVCGLALYPIRRFSGRTLVAIGAVLLLMAVPMWLAARGYIGFMRENARQVAAETEAGNPPTDWRKGAAEGWEKMSKEFNSTPESFQKSIDRHRGGYPRIVANRAGDLIFEHLFGPFLWFWWLIGGRMVLGMGLMKLGVFSAERSRGFYTRLALVGYGIGLPLVLADVAIDWHYRFFVGDNLAYVTGGWWLVNAVSSPFMALGHVAVVMLIFQSGAIAWLTTRLAAVGRMALSNYLFDSIVGTTIFYGYGLGLFGSVHRPGLYAIVLTIWAFQLWISPIWLARYRFGPAEWLWRSLTYGKRQPFRRDPEPLAIPL